MWVGKFALSPEGLPAGGVTWIDLGATAATSYSTVNGASYHKTYSSPDGISALYVTTEAVAAADAYIGGFRYRSDGALRVYDATAAVPAGSNTNQGIALTSDGQLCYTTGNTTAFSLNGVAVDTERRVYAAPLAFELQFADLGAGAVDTAEEVFDTTPTFTRATAATTVLSTGLIASVATGVARSYYDPTSLTYLGYLAEGARTNIALRSEEFDTGAVWAPTSCTVTANSIVAPDGATTAELLTADASGGVLIQTVTATATSGSYSIWSKQGNVSTQRLGIRNSTTATNLLFVTVDFATLDIVYLDGVTGATVKQYPNGWIRISLSVTSGITATDSLLLYAYSGDGATNGGTSYLWGAQYEEAAFASSYIPTTTAAVTRNADVLTYPTSGWLNASAGTLVANVAVQSTAADATNTRIVVSLDDGTGNEIIRLFILATDTFYDLQVLDGGVQQVFLQGDTAISTTLLKSASAFSANSFATVTNGGTVATDTSGTIPTVTAFGIGCNTSGTQQLFGPIRRVQYFAARLANATLQGLTA